MWLPQTIASSTRPELLASPRPLPTSAHSTQWVHQVQVIMWSYNSSKNRWSVGVPQLNTVNPQHFHKYWLFLMKHATNAESSPWKQAKGWSWQLAVNTWDTAASWERHTVCFYSMLVSHVLVSTLVKHGAFEVYYNNNAILGSSAHLPPTQAHTVLVTLEP